jgi:phospholipid transport system substrate-binding protein
MGLAAALIVLPLFSATDDTPDPGATIEDMADDVVMRLAVDRERLETDRAELDAMIDTLVKPTFEFRYASKLILGRHWKTTTAEQRTAFTKSFYDYLVRVYGHAMLHVDEDTLTVLSWEPGLDGDRAKVRTRLVMADGTEVKVDFRMSLVDGRWRAWDVVADGASYVRIYRAEFGSVIANDGMDALIEFLKTRSRKTSD